MPGHLYGYQLAHGVIPCLGWGDDNPTVCHTCDDHSCQRPEHLRLGTPAEKSGRVAGPPEGPREPSG
nr:HNH endonuclease [Streptomyces kronopolitis]